MAEQIPDSASNQWWIVTNEETTGPFGAGYVIASLRARVMAPDQLLCIVGGTKWRPAREWPQFRQHIPIDGPPKTVSSKPAAPASVDWIQVGVIYGLVANPLLWAFGLAAECTSGTMLAPEAPSYHWDLLIKLAVIIVGFMVGALWFLSGWWLRCRQRRGLWVSIAACVATHVYVIAALTISVILAMTTDGQAKYESSEFQLFISVFVIAIGLLEYIFQIVLVFMLWRHRKTISWADASLTVNQ